MNSDRVSAHIISTIRTRRLRAQNYLIIWADVTIDPEHEDFKNLLTQIRTVVSEVKVCLEPKECIDTLKELDEGKVFVILSGALVGQVVPVIHDIQRLNAIYIFDTNIALSEQCHVEWAKIRGVFTSMESICESLQKATRNSDHNDISMSFVSKQMIAAASESDKQNLDQLPPSYMYSTIFKEIILEIPDNDEKQLQEFLNYCRKLDVSEKSLKDFQSKYHKTLAVWWYTKPSFLYGMLNKALRSMDMEGMIKFGFFIRHLHLQIQQLYQEQLANFREPFTVYRGQGLSQDDFKNLYDSKGGLLSFNNFLSTSMDKEVSMVFVSSSIGNGEDIVAILFIIRIDPHKLSTTIPFALIDDYSAISSEKEVLFTMHTVFQVNDIKQSVLMDRLWEVQLTLRDDSDPDMAVLTNRLKEEVQGTTGWHRMGQLMIQLSHFDQAEELYNELLKNATTYSDIAEIYYRFGWLKADQGEYSKAIELFQESLQIKRKAIPENELSLATNYNNIGLAYSNMGDYEKALDNCEIARKIEEKLLAPNDPDLAMIYNNIGQVYDNLSDYSNALEYYKKSLKIKEKALPSTHPLLAIAYYNIGQVYSRIGDYSKALEYYEKDLKITKKALPETHPDFACSYSCIGEVYNNMGDYSKALEYNEKSLKIREKALSPTHPHSAITCSNIGDVHRLMGDHQKALEYHLKALDIQENEKCNPLECATIYVNLGETYREMKDYATALEYYEKALKIRDEKLPKNHPDLAVVYHNMSKLYLATQQCSTAMTYAKKAVDIAQEKLPSTHPRLLEYRETLEEIHKKI